MIIIDYKAGNVGSVLNMLKKIGVKAKLSSDPDEILAADKLILPGVGAFDNGMSNLHNSGLVDVLNQKVLIEKAPVLGICLGMQLLLEGSQEGRRYGLGWIKGASRKFDGRLVEQGLKIPHMGWNTVRASSNDLLFRELGDEPRFYFVHSYHVECENSTHVHGVTRHGYDFTSALHAENIYGVQFHPEKSHRFGMKMLQNFVGFA